LLLLVHFLELLHFQPNISKNEHRISVGIFNVSPVANWYGSVRPVPKTDEPWYYESAHIRETNTQ
jgi:hypothetical protein